MILAEHIFNVIAPYDCLFCTNEGGLVCDSCWPEAFEIIPERCFGCHVTSSQGAVCAKCHVRTPLDHVWVVSAYRGGARALVRRMKIDAQRQACLLIARAMHETAPYDSNILVTSVPTATARIRERGFDHGRAIAEEFAHLRGLQYRQLLIRRGRTKQAGASRAERQAQIRGMYQPKYRTNLKHLNILVVDDVTTTGATLGEVAKVLQKAGAEHINALVFAQTVG